MKIKNETLGEGTSRHMRTITPKEMQEGGKTIQAKKCFTRDVGKLWNQAPKEPQKGTNNRNCKGKNQTILQTPTNLDKDTGGNCRKEKRREEAMKNTAEKPPQRKHARRNQCRT